MAGPYTRKRIVSRTFFSGRENRAKNGGLSHESGETDQKPSSLPMPNPYASSPSRASSRSSRAGEPYLRLEMRVDQDALAVAGSTTGALPGFRAHPTVAASGAATLAICSPGP